MGKFKDFIEEKLDETMAALLDDDEIEEVYEEGDDIVDEDDWSENDKITETVKRKKVVRGGKVIIKKKSTKKGYKIKDGKEVRMDPKEVRARKIGQRKGSKKRKAQRSQIARKMKISKKKRDVASLGSQYSGSK